LLAHEAVSAQAKSAMTALSAGRKIFLSFSRQMTILNVCKSYFKFEGESNEPDNQKENDWNGGD
jgi:hypothetical protein